jgi:hypothetical protein
MRRRKSGWGARASDVHCMDTVEVTIDTVEVPACSFTQIDLEFVLP